MKKSKKIYRKLVDQADDIGDDNPMAYNELFALTFVAPYVASEKKIPPEFVQEMMRRSLYHIKWYFARTDLNTDKGKTENKKSIVKYAKWYTPEKEKQYPPPLSRWILSDSRMKAPAIIALPVAQSALMQKSWAFPS